MKKILVILLCLVSLRAASIALASESITLVVNARQLFPDVPPQIINGRVMVPLRTVAEALGAEVEWDDANKTVWVLTPPPPQLPELYTKLDAIPWFHNHLEGTVDRLTNPIEVIGPEDFQCEVREALTLLEKKAPKVYLNVETYLSKITLEERTTNSINEATAYLDPKTNTCVFYDPDFYATIDKLVSVAQQHLGVTITRPLVIAQIIVHETTHAQLNESWLTVELNSTDNEFIAELAAYRALEMLGAPGQYLEACKKANIQNQLYK